MSKTAWLLVLNAAAVSAAGRWWSHVTFLADDRLEGRATGSAGYRKAADYVAAEWKRLGVAPAGVSGYFQPVKFRSRRILEEQSSLALERDGKWEPLVLGEDAVLSLRTEPPASLEAPVVFAGYGLTVPEYQHEDLAGLDVRGKLVLYLSGGPSSIPGPVRSHFQSAAERWKSFERAGAVGALQIPNPRHMDIPWERAKLARLLPSLSLAEPEFRDARSGRLSVTVNPAHAGRLFAGSGRSFQQMLDLAEAGRPLPRFPLKVRVRARARFESAELECRNVVGVIEGSDPQLKREYVVVSAHLDHLGVGQPVRGDAIYNGAMDNAAGAASLLEIAERLKESGARLRRSLLLVALTGEEKGLLGSRYFARRPTVPAAQIVADLNLDMFLPLFPLRSLTAYGLEESDLGDLLREAARRTGVAIQPDPEPDRNLFIRSDQYNFILRGVPALAFKVGYERGSPEEKTAKTWLRERYHAPSDDARQPVDLEAADRFHRVILELIQLAAGAPERPRWKPGSFFRRFSERSD